LSFYNMAQRTQVLSDPPAGWYEALIECDRVIIRSGSREQLLADLCRHVVLASPIDAAWIGMVDAGDTKVWPQAHFGKDLGYRQFIESLVLLEASQSQGPTSMAIRENRAIWCKDLQSDPSLLAVSVWIKSHGWHSMAVLPLTKAGVPTGVLVLHAKAVNAFDATAQRLLGALASNIGHALDNFEHDAQRRLVDATLAESEARYSALFANNCMPMLLIDPVSLRVVDANIRAAHFYGWSHAELITKTVSDINTMSTDEVRREMALATAAGKTHFDFRHRLASGEIRDVEVFSSPVGFGWQTYLLSMIHDVSARREAESSMHNMQALIQKFIDELPGTAYLKDSQLRLLMVNKNLGEVLGVAPQALIGKTAHDIFPQDFADIITDLDKQMLMDGGHRTVEETFQGRHLETSMFVMRDASGAPYLGGLSLDVTERYHAAELTTVLLQINELGGLLSERDFLTRGLEMAEALTNSKIGFVHFVNTDQETLELVTWTANALKGCTTAFDNHYPVSQAGILADCVRNKAPVVFNDCGGYSAKRGLPEGHAPLIRLISVPVMERGQVQMMLGVGNKDTDYTDADVDTLNLIGNDLWRIAQRARAEAALRARVQELVALNETLADTQLQLLQSEKMASIGQLAAGVAHEINNPVGFVKSNLGTLAQYAGELLELVKGYAALEAQLGEPVASLCQPMRQRKQDMDFDFMLTDLPQLINESREGINRISQIVLDLKNFSRASDNEWCWADLHEGIESTINVVWNQLKYKVEVRRAYGELPHVYCVASQINQVLMNLLVNAGQAIVDKGHITIRTGIDGDHIWIEVQDDGCGMDAKTQARIFEPFFTTKPTGLGTGLGLSIASGIVSRHQGHLELHSEPGVGSTFRLVLPVNVHADKSAAPDQEKDTP
jgi:PAS domain S-box-containing protein